MNSVFPACKSASLSIGPTCSVEETCCRGDDTNTDRYAAYGDQRRVFKLLKPTGHVMHQQFNIQQLYVLRALYLCVLYLSENKQRLVPLTA